jgi:hypothetical protein
MVKQLEASPSVKNIVDEVAEGIAANKTTPFDAMLLFCKLCGALRSGDLICDWHKACLVIPETCNFCPTVDRKY